MTLHVDSEVGRLKQVILHRPDLELKRLTPSNHDEYLFDDVLWVKHAKQEHDAFAETLRDQGVEVHLLGDLLTRDLGGPGGEEVRPGAVPRRAASTARSRRTSLHRAFGAMDDAELTDLPDRRHDQAGAPGARATSRSPSSCTRSTSTTCCCRRCPTTSSPATPPPGSTTASRSTRCASGPGRARPSTTRRSTAGTRSSPTRPSTSGPKAPSTVPPPPRAATSWSWAAGRSWSA